MSINNKALNKSLLFFTISVVAILLSFSSLTYAKKAHHPVKIELANKISTRKISILSKRSNVKPIEVYFSQGDTRGGYRLQSGNSIQESMQKLKQKHKEFLNTALSNTNQRLSNVKGSGNEQRVNDLQSQLNVAKSLTKSQGVKISAIKVPNKDNSFVESLKAKNLIREIEKKPSSKKKIKRHAVKTWYSFQRQATTSIINVANASYNNESWAPYGGTSEIDQNGVFNTFYFNDLSNFNSWNAYEHETQVYNPDFVDYNGYWNSNMPHSYYDTQVSDSATPENLAVGTTRPTIMSTDTEYYTYMSLSDETASSAEVRIKGQKGQKAYPACHSNSWCVVKPLATTSSMAFFYAPGGLSWYY